MFLAEIGEWKWKVLSQCASQSESNSLTACRKNFLVIIVSSYVEAIYLLLYRPPDTLFTAAMFA